MQYWFPNGKAYIIHHMVYVIITPHLLYIQLFPLMAPAEAMLHVNMKNMFHVIVK